MFPNAEFVYVEDAGHWVHADKPREFLSIVSDFLGHGTGDQEDEEEEEES